jgi:uncharacterized protein with HEPN domain
MDERILKWIYDVKLAIDEIDTYFVKQKDFFEYQSNTMLKRAVERDLEIIGEAINRIITRDSDFQNQISEAKSIIGLRNQIVHAYDNISDELIWSILTNHLPKLKKEIAKLIQEVK